MRLTNQPAVSFFSINGVRHRPASIVKDFPGENPLQAAMVHDLYAVQVLLDRAEPDHFSAQFHRTVGGEVDLALAQLKWGGGPVASFAASYMTPVGMPPRGFDRTEVFGEGWSARISPNPRPIEVWDTQASWPLALEVRSDPPSGMMAEEDRCFCRVVRGLTGLSVKSLMVRPLPLRENVSTFLPMVIVISTG